MFIDRIVVRMGLGIALAACGCGEVLDETSEAPALAVIKARLSGDPSTVSGDAIAFSVMWEPPTALTRLECDRGPCSAPDTKEDYAAVAERNFDYIERFGAIDFVPACDGVFWEGNLTIEEQRKQLEQLESRLVFEPEFPISAAIELLDPPPSEARYALEQQGGRGILAVGRLVAYLDDNANGRFDHGTPDRAPETGLAVSADKGWLRTGEALEGFTVLYKAGTLNPQRLDAALREPLADLPDGYTVFVHRGDTTRRAGSDEVLGMTLDSEVRDDWFWCEQTRYGWSYQAVASNEAGSCVFWNPGHESFQSDWLGPDLSDQDSPCSAQRRSSRRCVTYPDVTDVPEDWATLIPEPWSCLDSVAVDLNESP